MNENLERLCGLAREFAPPEAVVEAEAGFSLALPDATLDFFAPGDARGGAYCRVKVGDLGEQGCSGAFAEAALKGNFFWRGTAGATLSLDEVANAIFLTDRFDDGAFADAPTLREYINDLLRTLFDWRARLGAGETAGKEAAV